MGTGDGRKQERLHDWDFSRALYLVLGIPFHAAVIYSFSHEWAVSSPDKSQALTWFANFIHSFRMPGFFLLAGVFSIMLLERQGARAWIEARLLRLGMPLLFATLLILPFQILVQSVALTVTGALPVSAFEGHVVSELTHFGEPWVSHLWFLWVLIAYCAGLAALHALVGGERLRTRIEAGVAWIGRNRILSLSAFAAICELAAYAQTMIAAASPQYGNAVINYNLYAPFFGLGVVLFYSRSLQELLLRSGPGCLAAGVALVSASQLPYAGPFTHTLAVMAGLIGAVLIVGFIAGLAQRHFSRPDPRIRNLVDASFTIYLFHHPVIMVLATLFLAVNLPPLVEFALIAPSTLLISYALHRFVSRSATLMLMFNGAVQTRPSAAPAASSGKPRPIDSPYPSQG